MHESRQADSSTSNSIRGTGAPRFEGGPQHARPVALLAAPLALPSTTNNHLLHHKRAYLAVLASAARPAPPPRATCGPCL
jgi:hypothetical protein